MHLPLVMPQSNPYLSLPSRYSEEELVAGGFEDGLSHIATSVCECGVHNPRRTTHKGASLKGTSKMVKHSYFRFNRHEPSSVLPSLASIHRALL